MSSITASDGRIIVQPEVNVVASTAESFRQELLRLITQNSAEIVVDLSKVERIDSVGLGVFIASYNTLKKKERQLKVINASPKIRSLFQTMGLTRLFAVRGKVA
jgi:anti-anti-sigma factor